MALIKAFLLSMAVLGTTVSAAPVLDSINTSLVPRQIIQPGLCVIRTVLDGDGSPRTVYLHKQLTVRSISDHDLLIQPAPKTSDY